MFLCFPNVEKNLQQNYVWKQLVLDLSNKIILLFPYLIFTDLKFPEFLIKFENFLAGYLHSFFEVCQCQWEP